MNAAPHAPDTGPQPGLEHSGLEHSGLEHSGLEHSGPEHCGLVAVIGAPNAGKSSLVNALVGQKVAIVSAKVQTTRTRLLGIALHETETARTQIILADTPGLFAPRRRLERAMVAAAWEGAHGADAVALVVDAKQTRRQDLDPILAALRARPERKLLVLNKIDLCAKPALLPLAQALNAEGDFAAVFFVSAQSGDGVAALKASLAALMPASTWHFPADQVSNASERLLATEITREQLFRQLHDELPHDSAVRPERYIHRPDGALEVHQQIVVTRESQRAIVLGRGGARIRAIGTAARTELAALLGCKVHLFLHVKVEARWDEARDLYAEIGLDWVT